jgi:hypothetical protein
MAKNTNNSAGAFIVERSGYKKYIRYFVATLTVVIFVSGATLATYNHLNKADKQSQVEEFSSELPGWWLDQYFGSSVCDKDICKADADPDTDKLTNAQEYFYHTNPLSAFTVKDEMNDGELVAAGFDPSRPGRLTFDQVISDENILGESLLLDLDIQKMVADDLNIDNVKLPLVRDDEIKIIYEATEVDYKNYSDQMKKSIEKYFSEHTMDSVISVLEKGDDSAVDEIKNKCVRLAAELREIKVPLPFLSFHKYNIALYEIMPKVLVSNHENLTGPAADSWFDNVQAMLALMQKLNFESKVLIAN